MLTPNSVVIKQGVGAVLHSNEFTRNFWRPSGSSGLMDAGILEVRDYKSEGYSRLKRPLFLARVNKEIIC